MLYKMCVLMKEHVYIYNHKEKELGLALICKTINIVQLLANSLCQP